ncbi:MAG: hypothetical protein ACOYL6_16795 [Bacteriovoracaceae bacterium]
MKNEKNQKILFAIIEDLENYFKRNSHISERKLSELSGVSRHYVRNIKGEKNFSTKKDLFKLYKVLQVIVPNKSIEYITALDQQFFNRSGIDVNFALKTLSLGRVKTEGSNDLYEVLADDNEAILVLLASEEEGVSERMIERVLGDSAGSTLKKLLDQNIVYQTGKRFKVNKNIYTNLSIRFIKKHVATLLGLYKISHAGKDRNYIGMSCGRTNKAGLKEMRNACEEFRKKIREIKDKVEFKGEIPCFTIHCFDTFIDNIDL